MASSVAARHSVAFHRLRASFLRLRHFSFPESIMLHRPRSIVLATLLMLAAAIALPLATTQAPAPQASATTAATPPAPAKPVFELTSDAALITLFIKPDKTADFEFVLTKLRDALQKSDRPERKQQAAGWRVFKSSQQVQGNAVYIMRIDPVVKGQEYDITRLIAEVFPVEVQEIFPKYRDAFAGRGITELVPVISMQP
jgi:hypothetical protein